jgi:CheY-like chemotaxis protein/HPt (histidine-containing phosphotransfer) domain-containing protein
MGTEPGVATSDGINRRTITSAIKPSTLRATLSELFEGRAAGGAAERSAHQPKIESQLAERLPLKILVTDDNVINQKVATRLLQQLGYSADVASNGAAAIAALEKVSYDLVFMDVQMPGMDGLETTRRIREGERFTGRHIIIVAMTANAMMGDRDRCLEAGMDDYLAKPVRPEALQATIERVASCVGSHKAAASVTCEGPRTANVSTQPSPAAGAATSETELLDVERLVEFAGGSRTALIEITDLYFSQTAEQLDQLEAAVRDQDATATARIAHSSAGASGVCGVIGMEPLFREVEQFGKQKRLTEAAALLPRLHSNFKRIRTLILNSRQNLPLS